MSDYVIHWKTGTEPGWRGPGGAIASPRRPRWTFSGNA